MQNLFLASLGLVALVGCGGTTVDFGTGGAGGAKSTSSGSTGAVTSTSSTHAATTGTSTSTTGTASTTGTSTTSTSSSSSSGGGTCPPVCAAGLTCCESACVNKTNDVLNCGACGNKCTGSHPYCNGGTCGAPPCEGTACPASEFCCGTECCAGGKLCCDVPQGVSVGPKCTDPVNGTCPVGCPACL